MGVAKSFRRGPPRLPRRRRFRPQGRPIRSGRRQEGEKGSMGRPRIKDVAEYAGVSAKTVSNVLNDYEHVSERTRAAVREAIDARGYRVNIAGRQLRRGRTGVVALAVPELDIAYFAELAKHVMAEAERRGRTTLLLETGGRREKELAAVQGFDAQFTDGVI